MHQLKTNQKRGRGRPKSALHMKRVTITLHPDDFKQFEVIGAKQGVPTARLVRQAMREYLERGSASRPKTPSGKPRRSLVGVGKAGENR